jgi:2-phospho-L-lactate transferase/gluconeogenesis factor (CofD/UPF0052 family)
LLKKNLSDDLEIKALIDKNRDLIEALSNLNQRLCCTEEGKVIPAENKPVVSHAETSDVDR